MNRSGQCKQDGGSEILSFQVQVVEWCLLNSLVLSVQNLIHRKVFGTFHVKLHKSEWVLMIVIWNFHQIINRIFILINYLFFRLVWLLMRQISCHLRALSTIKFEVLDRLDERMVEYGIGVLRLRKVLDRTFQQSFQNGLTGPINCSLYHDLMSMA